MDSLFPLHTSNSSQIHSHGKIITFIMYIGITIEILLSIRLFLKLVGANVGHSFTQFIYVITYPLVSPLMSYMSVFKFNESIIEVSTLLTMIIYATSIWFFYEINTLVRTFHRNSLHKEVTI